MNTSHDFAYGGSAGDDVADTADFMPAARPAKDDAELLRVMADFIARNPDLLGGGDLLTITGGKPSVRAGLFAAVHAGLGREDGQLEKSISDFDHAKLFGTKE